MGKPIDELDLESMVDVQPTETVAAEKPAEAATEIQTEEKAV